MIPNLTVGNATTDGAPFGGWFVGKLDAWVAERRASFGDDIDFGLRATEALEVKWGTHPAGIPRPGGWAPAAPVVTLSVLISGEFSITVRADPDSPETEVRLREPGDYAILGTDGEHTWCAIREAVILSVRWPAPAVR
jgi:hypothetical protein